MAATGNQPIKSWAEDDRPREKLSAKGKLSLSNAELLAILIGSGTREESAVEVSKKILRLASNNLTELGKLSIRELQQVKGIGEAKAITIAAALELGARRRQTAALDKQKISSSLDAVEVFQPILGDLKHEEFWILLLNRGNKIIDKKQISGGGIAGTVADPKIIFKHALDASASSLILCHNHPSGNIRPSGADIKLTQKMVQAGKLLDISILDHLIVTDDGYYSFADHDMIHEFTKAIS